MRHDGDPEGTHLRADELLVEAVRELGAETSYPESEIESLIAAYERVPKWYA